MNKSTSISIIGLITIIAISIALYIYYNPSTDPLVTQSPIEIVTDIAVTGDGGNAWGGHQTRIVHTRDGIFTAYTVDTGNGYFDREWRLAERQSDGNWVVIAQGISGREPVNLLAAPDGTLNIVGWPNGIATLWFGKPQKGAIVMTLTQIPNQLNGNWPYNSAGIDKKGNLCILSSEGGEKPGGKFRIACYLPSKKQWKTQTSSLDFRFCYTYVFPGKNGQLSLVSTRDVRWEALNYEKPAGDDYVFNAFGYWETDDLSTTPITMVYFREEAPTPNYPNVMLSAEQDAYMDTSGRMHIIYRMQSESTAGEWISRHTIISPDGELIHDMELPREAGSFLRIFQDRVGRFYLLGSSGYLYPMGMDGTQIGDPFKLDLGGYQVEYAGYGISVPRTGTKPKDVLDIVFPSEGGSKWIYFQLNFSGR